MCVFSKNCRLFLFAVLGCCLCIALPEMCTAAGGPENVLLVVNRNSADSLTVANHYIALRKIPAENVLTLQWDPKAQTTDIDTFRKQILAPVFVTIQKRRLARQIDYVVYSCDFPWGINLETDAKRFLEAANKLAENTDDDEPAPKPTWPKQLTKVGSINGLTYVYQSVLKGTPDYIQLRSNRYMRLPTAQQRDAPTLAFGSSQHFGPNGELLDKGGMRYMLSVMLGVTTGRGNPVGEVLDYLQRSAAADGTHPPGTIYFMQNGNIRSKARHDAFPEAVRELRALGVSAEILEGTLPMNKDDVQGVMIGAAGFDWPSSGSTILPGAVCEHFTSFGGVMRSGAGQTPCSVFLRYGAAGASGTVTEPYAMPHKFPAATVQVHYAHGCTLAEAFYQSVHAPYQLLILGDPLCRPWANIPSVSVEGIEPGTTVKGTLVFRPSATVPGGAKIGVAGGRAEGDAKVEQFRLFVDGLLSAECEAGGILTLDTTQFADGHHELRVVAIQSGPIRSQGRRILAVAIDNHGRKISMSVSPEGTVPSGTLLTVTASSADSFGIVVLHNSRLVGRIAGHEGTVEIDSATLGTGPVQLRAVGLGGSGPRSYVWTKPVEVILE